MKRPTDAQVSYIPQLIEKFIDFCYKHDDRPPANDAQGTEVEKADWEMDVTDVLEAVQEQANNVRDSMEEWQTSYDDAKEDARENKERIEQANFEFWCKEAYNGLQDSLVSLMVAIDKLEAFMKEKGCVGACVSECTRIKAKVVEFQNKTKELYNYVAPSSSSPSPGSNNKKSKGRKSGKKSSCVGRFITFLMLAATIYAIYWVVVLIKESLK